MTKENEVDLTFSVLSWSLIVFFKELMKNFNYYWAYSSVG